MGSIALVGGRLPEESLFLSLDEFGKLVSLTLPQWSFEMQMLLSICQENIHIVRWLYKEFYESPEGKGKGKVN